MILAGSSALKEHFGKNFWREVKDIDYICTPEEYDEFIRTCPSKIIVKVPNKRGMTVHVLGSKPIEFEIAFPGSLTEEFLDLRAPGSPSHLYPEEVYMLKMSHRYLKDSPHFLKTMNDIIQLRARGYDKIWMKDWFKKREKETYSYNLPKLNMEKNDFFTKESGVKYVYDHDSIHEAVAIGKRPAFFDFQVDGEQVLTSKEKFFALPIGKQLLATLEESLVLALERHQIPNNFTPDRDKSFKIALMKVCTSITSGWFREFSWENYHSVIGMYEMLPSYVDTFKNALEAGKIRPFMGTK